MSATKINLKLYARGDLPEASLFVATFHDLIRRHEPGELMIDVVDYGHVHDGPAVLFVGHESDYAIDHGEGRAGLLYQRKRAPAPGDGSFDPRSGSASTGLRPDEGAGRFAAHLADALRRALGFAARLEKEPALTGLRFGADEILLRIADRLHAPNEPATFAALEPDLRAAAERLWGGATVTYEPGDGRGMFAARLRAAKDPGAVEGLLARLG